MSLNSQEHGRRAARVRWEGHETLEVRAKREGVSVSTLRRRLAKEKQPKSLLRSLRSHKSR